MSIQYTNDERDAIERLVSELGIVLPCVPTLAEEIDVDCSTTDSYAFDETLSITTQICGATVSDSW